MTEPTAPSRFASLRKPSWRWAVIVLGVLALAFGVQRLRRAGKAVHPRARATLNHPASASASASASAPDPDPVRIPDDAAASPITPAELAILAPLTVGSTLGPATVTRLEGMRNGALSVHVRIGSVSQTFRIAKAEGSRIRHVVGPYTVYMLGAGSEWGRNFIEQTWRALDAIILTNANVPVPPGMRPASEPATTIVRVDWRI
jgi:hypothetical protein